jgi:hypothetical protein
MGSFQNTINGQRLTSAPILKYLSLLAPEIPKTHGYSRMKQKILNDHIPGLESLTRFTYSGSQCLYPLLKFSPEKGLSHKAQSLWTADIKHLII